MKNAIIRLENISKIYGKDDYKTVALKDINLEIFEGDFVSIMGPSGSGKTTLLNIIGFIDTPTDGKYFLKGQDVNKWPGQVSQIKRHRSEFYIPAVCPS